MSNKEIQEFKTMLIGFLNMKPKHWSWDEYFEKLLFPSD